MKLLLNRFLGCILVFLAVLLITGHISASENTPYIHNDISGSPLAATDASGKLLWKENYRPYGERVANSQTATASNSLWFTGKPQDAQTGLSYMGARLQVHQAPAAASRAPMHPAAGRAGRRHCEISKLDYGLRIAAFMIAARA